MQQARNRSSAFLNKDFHRMQSNPSPHYSIGLKDNDIYTWQILIIGPPDTLHEHAIYRAIMTFPVTYPEDPPTFTFKSVMFHPNINLDGAVCISILHKGDDVYGYEERSERWLPVRSPDSVIMSVIALLSEVNCESPANLDAARMYMENRAEYERRVKKL
ncbi:Ubiquitin-conjugating enzyme E2 15, partial [Conglomerata obtusa]